MKYAVPGPRPQGRRRPGPHARGSAVPSASSGSSWSRSSACSSASCSASTSPSCSGSAATRAWPSTRAALKAVGLSMLIELAAGLLAAATWLVGGDPHLTWRSSSRSSPPSPTASPTSSAASCPVVRRPGRSPWSARRRRRSASRPPRCSSRRPDRRRLRLGLLAGVGSGTGTGFLYRGFSSGRMGVVAPVSAVGAALVPVLVGTLAGERLVAPRLGRDRRWPCPASGWSRARRDPLEAGGPRESVAAGLVDGVLAGLGFGLLFAALGQVPDRAGLVAADGLPGGQRPRGRAARDGAAADWVPRGPRGAAAALCGPLGARRRPALFLLATQQATSPSPGC